MRVSNLYNNPASNNSYAGIIDALQTVAANQGYNLPEEYPPNYRGIIKAILALKELGGAGSGDIPPGWQPEYDDDGNIIGGDWLNYPYDGALWYDTRQGRLFVWEDGAYYQANGADGLTVVGDDAPQREVIGGLWYNTNNNNLYLYDGTTWTIVGGDAAVSTATLPLANPTTDNFKSNRPYLPDTTNLVTQENYNTWVYDALVELEAEIESIDPEVPLYKGATPPTETQDFWYDTANLRLLVNYDGAYVPTAIPLSSDADFVSLTNTVADTTNELNSRVSTIKSALEILEALPRRTYTVTTDQNININHGAGTGVYVIDNYNQYTGVTITGTNGVRVTSNATGIKLDALELSRQVEEILGDYLQATDKIALQIKDQDLQAQINAIDYVSTDELAAVQQQVNGLPTTEEVSSRLSTAGGHLYGDLSMNGNLITGLPIPETNSGAATKLYVDTLRADVDQEYFKKNDGTLRNVTIQNVNLDKPAFDFSTSSTDGNNAFKFKSNIGQSYTTFGTNDKNWELAWQFDSKEDYCWRAGDKKVVSITKDGLTTKNLILGTFGENTADGQVVVNKIDVAERLTTLKSRLDGFRAALLLSDDFEEFKTKAVEALTGI